jgi:hypothetical protein
MGFAMIVTAVVLLLVSPGYRYRGPLVATSGIWAVVPDFHHALWFAPTLQARWKTVLHETVLTDLFWLHRTIDRADPRDSPGLSLAMWGAALVVLLGTELVIRRRRRAAWTEPE